MNLPRRQFLHLTAGAVAAPAVASRAFADAYPSRPVRFDGAPPKLEPSPLLGQHVDDVLGSWLGMGAKEVAALREEGII